MKMKNINKWDSLSIKNKADLMKLYIKNGINNLEEIRSHYNKFAGGYTEEEDIQEIVNKVNSSKANFVERLKDPNREFIDDWASDAIATHKLGVATDNKGNHYIYPEVQKIKGKLIDFTRHPYNRNAGVITAEERGDTVRVNSIEEGLKFTENYKKYYPTFNRFQDGGERNTINSRHAKLLARRGMPGDIEALRAAGYDKYGNPIVVSGEGSFGGGGAGAVFNTDNIKSEDYDYIRNTPLLYSFSDAFNNARKAGKNTFIFNGKEYTTEVSDNPKYIGKQYEPALNIREVLDKNMKVIPDSTRIEPYLGQIPGTSKREKKYKDGGKLGVPYKSLNNSDYDYYNASIDNMPTKKGEHWTSRNPNTGRILKGASHPTIDVALNMEGILGNKIYKNIDGTYSSYEENQFPTSWGVQINNYEYDVSPLDPNKRFKDIKTTKGRKYNEANITYISDKLNNTLLSDVQKNAILGSIIEESGGNPFAVDETGKFKGLLQWEDSRYSPDNSLSEREEIDKQLQYLIETLYNTDDKKSWTHGGKGSGYKSAKHARDSFLKAEDLYKAVHSLNRGYIRPTGGDYSVKNRYKVAKQIK